MSLAAYSMEASTSSILETNAEVRLLGLNLRGWVEAAVCCSECMLLPDAVLGAEFDDLAGDILSSDDVKPAYESLDRLGEDEGRDDRPDCVLATKFA